MAYNLGDKYASVVVAWDQIMEAYLPSWDKIANIRADNAFSLQNYADITPGALASWNGTDPITEAATSYGSFAEQVVTADGSGRRIKLSRRDVELDSGLVERKAEQLLQAAQQTIERDVYAALTGGFTHSVDNGGGGTTAAINGAFVLADGSSQTNGLTAALTASSLDSARQILMNWKNYNGDPMGLGFGPLALVVSPKNATIAEQITKSPLAVETYVSTVTAATGASINPQANHPYQVIVSPYINDDTNDADDWFLVQTGMQSPVTYWTASAPKLVIEENALDQTVEMSVSMYSKVYIQTPPNGIVGSNVA
jgi:hypothetical protein